MSQTPTNDQELSREQKRERLKQLLLERNKPVAYPLSFSQQSLWIQDKFEGSGAVYNMKFGLTLDGTLDAALLEQVFNRIVARHDTLRSVFGEVEGEPRQLVYPNRPVKMVVVDLQSFPLALAGDLARSLLVTHCQGLFDLSKGPLFRAFLYRLAPDRHIQLLVMHHTINDGWSMGIFVHETVASYSALIGGKEPVLPALAVQFSDYASRQREMVSSGGMDRTLAYWKEQLAGAPALLDLAIEKPRPAVMRFQGGWETFEVPAAHVKPLRELARTTGSTLFMVLNAAFGVLMARYTGQEDMVIGTPLANRRRPEYQALIGFFANMIPLRLDLTGEPSFKELVRRTKSICRDAFANQAIPFPYLLQELDLPRHSDYQSLVQVMFALHSFEVGDLGIPGVAVAQFPVDAGTSMFDLYLAMTEKGDVLDCSVEYNGDLFSRQGVHRLIGHMLTLLSDLAAQADQPISLLNVLTDAERQDLLVAWQGPAQAVPALSVSGLIAQRAALAAAAPALEQGAEVWSYGQLSAMASQIAAFLTRQGVGPGVLVGVASDSLSDQIASLLGILQSGAGFLVLPGSIEENTTSLPKNCLVLTRSGWRLNRRLPSATWRRFSKVKAQRILPERFQ